MAEFAFEDDTDEDCVCPICLEVQREAHLTKCCGKHFCFLCIDRVVREAKSCPTCNFAPLEIFPNKERQRKIDVLRVRCQHVAEGSGIQCQWRGELRDLERHSEDGHSYGTEAAGTEQRKDNASGASTSAKALSLTDEVTQLKEVWHSNSISSANPAVVAETTGNLARLSISGSPIHMITASHSPVISHGHSPPPPHHHHPPQPAHTPPSSHHQPPPPPHHYPPPSHHPHFPPHHHNPFYPRGQFGHYHSPFGPHHRPLHPHHHPRHHPHHPHHRAHHPGHPPRHFRHCQPRQ